MSAELVAGIVAVVVALVGGAAGWFGRQQYGAEREKRKQAEGERDDERTRSRISGQAPASPSEAARLLDRVRRRRQRLRDEENRLE